MPKQLLIEQSFVVHPQSVLESTGSKQKGYIVESTMRDGREVMKIRFPATILDSKNENGRIYSKVVMEGAIRRCAEQIRNRELLSAVDGHPEGPYVEPGNASHVITGAWIEGNTFMNEAEILGTAKGNDFRALVEAKVAIGFSIRGLGSVDSYGNLLEDYEYLGVDAVSQPSARIRAIPEVIDSDNKGVTHESVQSSQSFNHNLRENKQMNLNEAKQYISEQITLLNVEQDKLAKFNRAASVENKLSEMTTIPHKEMLSLYAEWNEAKTKAFAEAKSTKGRTLEEAEAMVSALEAQLNTQSKIHAKSFNTMKERYEKSLDNLAKQLRKESKLRATQTKMVENLRNLKDKFKAQLNETQEQAAKRIAEAEVLAEMALVEGKKTVRELTKVYKAEAVKVIKARVGQSKGKKASSRISESTKAKKGLVTESKKGASLVNRNTIVDVTKAVKEPKNKVVRAEEHGVLGFL